jgi:predicted metalloprotease
MRWQGRRQSENIRDMRGSGNLGGLGGGLGGRGGGPFVVRRAGGGGIGVIILILAVSYFLGINPLELLSGQSINGTSIQSEQSVSPQDDQAKAFVATVLADTEDAWTQILGEQGIRYPKPTLTLFRGSVNSGCGFASAATGPFYCPVDKNIYIDLGFYDELSRRFGAPGDFAQAYVLAHEVGHHVQNVLGTLGPVHEKEAALGKTEANALSVLTELQADCFAGIWAKYTQGEGILDAGDIDEALTAAAAVGDDTLQKQTQGYVVPDSFTHGTSEERAKWFRRGYESGQIDACDTFKEGA